MDVFMYDHVPFLTILDVELNYLWVFRLQDKTRDEVQSMFEAFWNSLDGNIKARLRILLTDNGKEFQFEQFFVPELKKMKSSVYHPQGNSFVERKHKEISVQCRIHEVYPDELKESVLNANAKVLNVDNLVLRYLPKDHRKKSDDVWKFMESKGYRNQNTSSIIAKDLESNRISYLHKDDYKFVKRPSVLDWEINDKYLDVITEFDIDLKLDQFEEMNLNVSWENKNIFCDLYDFYDLGMVLEKAKRESANSLLFIMPDWNENEICKQFDYIKADLIELESNLDLVLNRKTKQNVGKLNFRIWVGYTMDFTYVSDWGGDVVDDAMQKSDNRESEVELD
jgi:hypothetical protein